MADGKLQGMEHNKKAEKVKKLFRQAEDAEKNGRKKEAEAFFEKASQLINDMGADEAVLRAQMTDEDRAGTLAITRVKIGEPRSRGLKQRANNLAWIVEMMVGVRCNLSYDGSHIIVFGTREMGEQSKNIVNGITQTMNTARALAQKKHRENEMGKDRNMRRRFSVLDYEAGYLDAMGALAFQTSQARKSYAENNTPGPEIDPTEYTAAHSTALAIQSREVEIQDYYKSASTAKGRFSYNSGSCFTQDYQRGQEAAKGENIVGQRAIG